MSSILKKISCYEIKYNDYMIIDVSPFKIVVLSRLKSYFVGIFNEDSQNQFNKLLVSYLSIAFANFGIDFEKVNSLSTKYFLLNDAKQVDFSKKDPVNLKLLETFFISAFVKHFGDIHDHISKSEEMNLNYIKFKNLYIIDLSNETVMFDLLKSRNNDKKKNYYNNQEVWQEIIYHSQVMRSSYNQELGNNHDMTDAAFRVSVLFYLSLQKSSLLQHTLV